MSKKESGVNVTYEDQVKINTFARNNALLQDLKEEIETRKKNVENIDDAETEIMMLDDSEDTVPYQIGEVFVHLQQSEVNEKLAEAKSELKKEISDMEAQAERYKSILDGLKIQLYAKFGNDINLEAEEDD